MTITVYSKPSCVQCDATYRHMDKSGVQYESVDITRDESAMEFVISEGYQQVPVVAVRNEAGETVDHWSGFRPDRIAAYKEEKVLANA